MLCSLSDNYSVVTHGNPTHAQVRLQVRCQQYTNICQKFSNTLLSYTTISSSSVPSSTNTVLPKDICYKNTPHKQLLTNPAISTHGLPPEILNAGRELTQTSQLHRLQSLT